ncbi:MAG TPA: aminotransferase class V-fold PLP-dependent enzyme [Acidimicrobiales bacterium]|nr:aminotransferase class V-fold PLP-dependent enzyme [Acidimicrobiales bacterium]
MTEPQHPQVPPVPLVGDDLLVPCVDGQERRYLSCDAAASTAAFRAVLEAVEDFVPWYSSVHRGAGYKSQRATDAYESAREAALRFAGRSGRDDVAIFCRNTTEAINHLAYRLRLSAGDVVATTVVEHHANLLPWSRVAHCRFVDCGADGTFSTADVVEALEATPAPRLLAVTGASNITGWMPPVDELVAEAHKRGVPVAVDAAQLAPHRPLPTAADYIVWSGHKMYAPFGAGILIGPRRAFAEGDPFIVGGGAVDLVDLDQVVWTVPPDREEAGSPNVIGAVALNAAINQFEEIGWRAVTAHDKEISSALRKGLAAIPGVNLLGPGLGTETLPVATFTVDGMPHGLVAARLAAENAIAVRHGCFCAHPYLMRLLGLGKQEIEEYRAQVSRGDRTRMPGGVRASLGINGSVADVEHLCAAVARLASLEEAPVYYVQDPLTGDFSPGPTSAPWLAAPRQHGSSCSPG